MQETIEENLSEEKSDETLTKLTEEKGFEDLQVDEIKDLTENTKVEEEILPEIGAYSTCFYIFIFKRKSNIKVFASTHLFISKFKQ